MYALSGANATSTTGATAGANASCDTVSFREGTFASCASFNGSSGANGNAAAGAGGVGGGSAASLVHAGYVGGTSSESAGSGGAGTAADGAAATTITGGAGGKILTEHWEARAVRATAIQVPCRGAGEVEAAELAQLDIMTLSSPA